MLITKDIKTDREHDGRSLTVAAACGIESTRYVIDFKNIKYLFFLLTYLESECIHVHG